MDAPAKKYLPGARYLLPAADDTWHGKTNKYKAKEEPLLTTPKETKPPFLKP